MLVRDKLSWPVLHFYQVSSKYFKHAYAYADADADADANGIRPKTICPPPVGGGREGGGCGHN